MIFKIPFTKRFERRFDIVNYSYFTGWWQLAVRIRWGTSPRCIVKTQALGGRIIWDWIHS